jgi:hypothetical protein
MYRGDFQQSGESLGMFGGAAAAMGTGQFGLSSLAQPAGRPNAQFGSSADSLRLDVQDMTMSGSNGPGYSHDQDIYYLPSGTSNSFSVGNLDKNHSYQQILNGRWNGTVGFWIFHGNIRCSSSISTGAGRREVRRLQSLVVEAARSPEKRRRSRKALHAQFIWSSPILMDMKQ